MTRMQPHLHLSAAPLFAPFARVWMGLSARIVGSFFIAATGVLPAGAEGVLSRPSLVMSPTLIEALRANELGRATDYQKALLFRENDTVNRARLNDWISDSQYQAAQTDFAQRNEAFARAAATEVTGNKDAFRVQATKPGKPKIYAPGTDSDYIIEVKRPEQIRGMQNSYNQQIDAYLRQNNLSEGPGKNWHNRLDTDFMADPRGVSKAEFEKIATMNNDAYRRQGAAEYERISRASDGTKVGPQHVRPYAEEVVEFRDKKDTKLGSLQRNPELWQDGRMRADISRLWAQEQKYIERVESTVDLVRKQNGLPPIDRGSANTARSLYTVETDADGKTVLKKNALLDVDGNPRLVGEGSVAKRGAARSPEALMETIRGRALAENSLNRAVRQLAETYVEVSRVNPEFKAAMVEDVAALTKKLPAAEKGALLETIRDIGASNFEAEGLSPDKARAEADALTKRFARSMRDVAPQRDASIAARLQRALNEGRLQALSEGVKPGSFEEATRAVDNIIAEQLKLSENATPTRRQFNEAVSKRLPGIMNLIDKGFTLLELYESGSLVLEYAAEMTEAYNPNIPQEERDFYHEAAYEAAGQLAVRGTLGGSMLQFCKMFPTMCAVLGSLAGGYMGGRYALENTETGQAIDAAAGRAFDSAFETMDEIAASLNGRPAPGREGRPAMRALLQRYMALLDAGTLEFREGMDIEDLFAALDDFAQNGGDLRRISRDILRRPGGGQEVAGLPVTPPEIVAPTDPPAPPPPPPLGPGETRPPPLVQTVPEGSRGPCPDGSWPLPTTAGPAYSDGPLTGDVTADFSPKPLNCAPQPAPVPSGTPPQQQAALAPPAGPRDRDDLEAWRDRCGKEMKDVVDDVFADEKQKGAKIDTAFIEANAERLGQEVGRRLDQLKRDCEGPQVIDDENWALMLQRSGICAEEAEAAKQAEDKRASMVRGGAAAAELARPNEDAAKARGDLDACLDASTRQVAAAQPPATDAGGVWTPPAAYVPPPADAPRVAAATPDLPAAGSNWQPPAGLALPANAPTTPAVSDDESKLKAPDGHVTATGPTEPGVWTPPTAPPGQAAEGHVPASTPSGSGASDKQGFTPPAPYEPSVRQEHATAPIADGSPPEKRSEAALARAHAAEQKRVEGQCRAEYGSRFVRVVQQDNALACQHCDPGYVSDGGQCAMTAEQATAQCRQQYGGSFLTISKIGINYQCMFCDPGYIPAGTECLPTPEVATSLCQQQYGRQFARLVPNGNRYDCMYCSAGSYPSNGQCMSAGSNRSRQARVSNRRSYVPRAGRNYVPRKPYYTQRYVPRYNPGGGHQSGGMIRDH